MFLSVSLFKVLIWYSKVLLLSDTCYTHYRATILKPIFSNYISKKTYQYKNPFNFVLRKKNVCIKELFFKDAKSVVKEYSKSLQFGTFPRFLFAGYPGLVSGQDTWISLNFLYNKRK